MGERLQPGICGECGGAIIPGHIGYHSWCAVEVHEREGREHDRTHPFVVIDGDGCEIERFDNETDAEEFLEKMRNSTLQNRTQSK